MFIRMIGMFEVRDESGLDRTPRGAKARAILAMLARTPGHSRPRRWLEQRLWSDRGPEQASGSLRQALTEVRKALGPLAWRVTSNRDGVTLSEFQTDVTVEAARARALLGQGRDFLEGIDIIDPAFRRWLAEERQRVAAFLGAQGPDIRQSAPFSLRLDDLPEGMDSALARDLAAAIARLTAEYLLGKSLRGLTGDRIPAGLSLMVEGDWSEDRAYLKVRLVDQASDRTLWSQRLLASRVAESRGDVPLLAFDATDGKLM